MSQFIRLSNRIINTKFIQRIDFSKDMQMFSIYMSHNHIQGITIFGSGTIRSEQSIIIADKIKHPESYKAIEDWITKTPM